MTAAIVVLTVAGFRAATPVAARTQRADVTVASGDLDHLRLADDLFHIHDLWIRVAAGTEFHRWLSQGIDREAAIILTTNADRVGDDRNVRILSGRLIHQTAPNPTPSSTDAVGALPPGNLSVVHILYLRDDLTGSLGAVAFQTSDFATASRFDAYDDQTVSTSSRSSDLSRRPRRTAVRWRRSPPWPAPRRS